jgi:hypothetical protein
MKSKLFYKFLGLGYTDLKHAEYGLQSGVVSADEYTLIKNAVVKRQQPLWNTPLGGAVDIHGRMPAESTADRPLAEVNLDRGVHSSGLFRYR